LTKQIAKLAAGERVRLLFQGSKSLGNEPYELDASFEQLTGVGEDAEAVFKVDGGDEFTAYRFRGRWCYGTSAERLSLIA
jgi:hypothetical protein